jgi:hypothetical protein
MNYVTILKSYIKVLVYHKLTFLNYKITTSLSFDELKN